MRRDDPVLVAVCGLPGVGKSTVSSHVRDAVGGVRLRTDVIRKELFDEPRYTDAERERVYGELFSRTGALLERGETVVIDATLAERSRREDARTLAREHGAEFRLVQVVCTATVAEGRIAEREGLSDADVDVHREFREEFDPLESEHDRVDNSGTLAETRRQVDSLF